MRLLQIVELLKHTELKQIIIGEDDPQILSLLNLALIDVYARLELLQEEQLITMVANKTRYRLQDNSQKVLQVYGFFYDQQDEAEEMAINDINNDTSVFTPQPYVLHVPNPYDGKTLSVMQVVTPPFVTAGNIDTLDFIVPPQLLEPISNYIGYRAYKSMNGDEKSEQGAHHRRYLASIEDVRRMGLVHYSIMTNLKLVNRGFGGVVYENS